MSETENLQIFNVEKSQQLIGNNIQEKLFYAKLYDYKDKQKKLLKKSKELVETHHTCTELSKQSDTTKDVYIEEVEHVVARIVRDAFGMRVLQVTEDGVPSSDRGGQAERAARPLSADDLRVWDARSPHARVLDAIAGKLLAAHHRRRAAGTTADPERHQLADAMTCVRDALRECDHGGAAAAAASRRPRDLRKRLSLVADRLKTVVKEKRDLLDALHGVARPSDPGALAAESLRVMLDREREKNVRLQTTVNEMYAATAIAAKRQNAAGAKDN